MANDNKDKQFEKLSFWQLLEKTSVEIPIIQRDYAQGRKNQAKVRDEFLSALYDGLTQTDVELDFVYGSEENNILQPLDGQQRLTTLFLLHWYIAVKENKLELAKDKLSRFTYETRTSSREFCNELVQKGISFEKDEIISDLIKNKAWFVASWEKDPTILAMLIMLDAIHAKFKDNTIDLWEKLTEEQIITFLYVRLKDFGLSDDLYIKMNARGKQLTHFENFKSLFEKYIENKKFEENITNLEKKFAHKIDTVWTDLFWQYRGNDGLIDNGLINFIAGVAINHYAQEYISSQKDEIKNRMQFLANPPKDENGKTILPEDFSIKEAFQYLVNCLDKYSENDNSKKKSNVNLWSCCDKTLFEDLINVSDATQQCRVLFYAQTEYLLKNHNFDQCGFNDWMRVVRNLVENAYSGNWNIDNVINLIKLIHSWSDNSKDIYVFLSTLDISKISIAKEQVKQEIEKAKIIIANPNAKQIIHDTEDTNFCKGEIKFALFCADYDIGNNPNPQNFDSEKLKEIKNAIEKHLAKNDVTNDFRRAFFTIGNNDFYDYWKGNFQYYGGTYKRCLIGNTANLKSMFSNSKEKVRRSYIKELIVKLSKQNIDEIITDFINTDKYSTLPNWKKRIISEKGLLNFSEQHYMVIYNNVCYLLKDSKITDEKFDDEDPDKVERVD